MNRDTKRMVVTALLDGMDAHMEEQVTWTFFSNFSLNELLIIKWYLEIFNSQFGVSEFIIFGLVFFPGNGSKLLFVIMPVRNTAGNSFRLWSCSAFACCCITASQ